MEITVLLRLQGPKEKDGAASTAHGEMVSMGSTESKIQLWKQPNVLDSLWDPVEVLLQC
jgi:hypothetical protein